MRHARLASILAIALIATVALSGCQMIAQKAVENATGVKVDQSTGKTTITGKDGQSATLSGSDNKLPDGLPADVPTYQGTIKGSASVSTNGNQSWSFTVTTTDDVATVTSWYKTQLADKGWTIDSAATVNGNSVISAKNGANKLAVTATKGDAGTDVFTMVTNAQ
jgi:hypothetical protein